MLTLTAKNCDDLSLMQVDRGWICPPGTEFPAGVAALPEGDKPKGPWKHFKGHQYQVLGTVQHASSKEFWVVYQDSQGTWARLLVQWCSWVDREKYRGPRFTSGDYFIYDGTTYQSQVNDRGYPAWERTPQRPLSMREVLSCIDDEGRFRCPSCGRFAVDRQMTRDNLVRTANGGTVSLAPRCTRCK